MWRCGGRRGDLQTVGVLRVEPSERLEVGKQGCLIAEVVISVLTVGKVGRGQIGAVAKLLSTVTTRLLGLPHTRSTTPHHRRHTTCSATAPTLHRTASARCAPSSRADWGCGRTTPRRGPGTLRRAAGGARRSMARGAFRELSGGGPRRWSRGGEVGLAGLSEGLLPGRARRVRYHSSSQARPTYQLALLDPDV